MDNFGDPFLSSASWSELNTPPRSSWVGCITSQANGWLTNSVEEYGGNVKHPPMCMIHSPHIMGNVDAEDLDLHAHSDSSSAFSDGNLKFVSQHELPIHKLHLRLDNETREGNLSLNEVFETDSASGSFGQKLNTSCSVTLPHISLTMPSLMERNSSEPSKFEHCPGDGNLISSVPSMWPPSYSCVPSFMEQGKLQDFGFQGVESDADELARTYIDNDTYPHMNNSAAASQRDCNVIHSNFHNFNLGQQMKTTHGGLHPCQQLSQSMEISTLEHQTNHSSVTQHQVTLANSSACNDAAKPRVRARRGQATDPHSIAERLRREKIAERMKNLQELVPNSIKVDKASMLDEIIDYVKFLQLQVKVLSMSRLGAAGAVVPLITDAQSECPGAPHLSSIGQGGAELSEDQDSLAFEQEVVKLMESNVTTAMQYLQNKGLCLMPIALAAAISSRKGSSMAAVPPDRRKADATHGAASWSLEERPSRDNGGHNGRNGGAIKKEDALKSVQAQ